MISTDAKMLEEGSPVRARMAQYGALFAELHIIVFTTKGNGGHARATISKNTFVYPTNSVSKLLYVPDAVKIGASIIANQKLSPTDSVITTQDPFETGLAGGKLSEKFKIPLHIQIHTDFHSPYFKNSLLNKVRIAISKRTLPRAAAVRAVSERIKSSLSPDLRAKTSVLPIFADLEVVRRTPITEDLRRKYPQFKKIVLMASRLTKEKDIETGVRAFFAVLKDYPDTGLFVVGSGPEEKKIKTAQSGNPAIIHLPWVPHHTLVSYMKTCDVFLSASLYEGYGLSMMEAHACETTLVVTDAGIAPMLTLETARPGDRETLARLLAKTLSGGFANRHYVYPYLSKQAYMEAYKDDIERALSQS